MLESINYFYFKMTIIVHQLFIPERNEQQMVDISKSFNGCDRCKLLLKDPEETGDGNVM